MTNIGFAEFQKENGYGSAEKYRDNNVYNKNIKSEMFTLTDWKNRSEKFLVSYLWDKGKGDFISVGNLASQLNK